MQRTGVPWPKVIPSHLLVSVSQSGPEQVTLLPSLPGAPGMTSQELPAPEAQLRTTLLSETVRLVSHGMNYFIFRA